MADQMPLPRGPMLWRALPHLLTPGALLLVLSLLAVMWLAPGLPVVNQDSAWVLALNQAVNDRLVFGRDVIFTLGPWGAVYAGQYHPATDGMMLFGGALTALALTAGLLTLARGRRRWLMLLAPLLVATVALHDPVFLAQPLLLLAVAVSLGGPPSRAGTVRRDGLGIAAVLLLTAGGAMLSLVKSTFGTQALPMTALALAALLAGGAVRLALAALAVYLASFAAFWLAAGQRLADLPGFFAAVPTAIGGYTEGLAKDGPWTDIAAYAAGAGVLLWLVWRDRGRRSLLGTALLLPGLAFTLFVAFKAGFVRHDEHALIACGTLAMLPLVLANALRARHLAVALATSLAVLAFVSHHYPGYAWPSLGHGETRIAAVASGAWTRMTDPGLLGRRYAAALAAIRAGHPLPAVTGPTDIYSSGQTVLIANGLQWSPRPALQSTTVVSAKLASIDLAHLEGTGGRPPVRNVFYRVESEDGRLPSTEDGLSWPALLSEFRVTSYDLGQDLALLQREPGATTAMPGPPLLDGQYPLGTELPLPALPGGLAWATLDLQPTLLGRLATLVFRPPLLSLTIQYAGGPPERYRLSSDLARAGFLLTPPIRNTEDMLLLLTPERRRPQHRPLSIALTGESGTRWLWRDRFTLKLQSIEIPLQDQVAAMLLTTPQPRVAKPAGAQAAACHIDFLNAAHTSPEAQAVTGSLRVSGWVVPSITGESAPDRVLVGLTDPAGRTWEAAAALTLRPDVAGYFVNPALDRTGFDMRLDLSSLAGPFALTLEAERDGRRWPCALRQDLVIARDQ